MASTSYNLLTTDGINSFIQDYTTKETTQKVTPLTTKLKGIQDLDTDYSSMIDKLAKRGIIHKNKAANLKSKLTKKVNAIA